MTTAEMQKEILRLKKEKGICILAHTYQPHSILEIADYTGDSFGLSEKAKEHPGQTVLMCGVRFMAETVKILSPEKTVILSHPEAGCPMAEQMTAEQIKELKKEYPNAAVVAYINTTAELKTVADVCVTSSSALKIVAEMPQKDIIFIPDRQLGSYVASKLPHKNIILTHGGCPTHSLVSAEVVREAKKKHPNAGLLVHPECLPEVTAEADFVGSTTEIMAYAARSDAKEFIIGTENSVAEHLSYDCPDKKFFVLSKDCVCHNMSLTTLPVVLACLRGEAGEIIELPCDIIDAARRSIDEMLRLGA